MDLLDRHFTPISDEHVAALPADASGGQLERHVVQRSILQPAS